MICAKMDVFGNLKAYLNNAEDSFVYEALEETAEVKENLKCFPLQNKPVSPQASTSNKSKEKEHSPKLPSVTVEPIKKTKKRANRKISYKKALEKAKMSVPQLNKQSPQKEISSHTTGLLNSNSNNLQVDLTGEFELEDFHNREPLFTQSSISREAKDGEMITINIKIKNRIRKFQLPEGKQRFSELIKKIADEENISSLNVFLYDPSEKRISPHSFINHKISTIYTCHLMNSPSVEIDKEDLLELKFQSNQWKKSVSIVSSRFEPLSEFVKKLCENGNVESDKISLQFDGETLDLARSPADMDFEGGEAIDCCIGS